MARVIMLTCVAILDAGLWLECGAILYICHEIGALSWLILCIWVEMDRSPDIDIVRHVVLTTDKGVL